jgi:hypothetical protein
MRATEEKRELTIMPTGSGSCFSSSMGLFSGSESPPLRDMAELAGGRYKKQALYSGSTQGGVRSGRFREKT